MKNIIAVFALLCLVTGLYTPVKAEENASDITAKCLITVDGKTNSRITDNNIYTYIEVKELNISSETPVYGIYIKFDRECAPWKLEADGVDSTEGVDGFLHQYVPLKGAKNVNISFEDGTSVADVFVFGQGELPDYVQMWEKADSADIMICPTHSDDDQLYFAGMIPWCVANGYKVQIVYLTNHLNTHDRPHELLDGLWHCGVKYYPHVSEFPDLYSETFEQAKQSYGAYGYQYEDFVEYYSNLLQLYKPLVVAGHDVNGEYGHGMHMLSFHALTDAVEQSAQKGLWDVPKTYIHLWGENSVVFDWDEPLEYFGGKSAFKVSQEGFNFHRSQHRFTGLTSWLYGTDAAPVTMASQIRGLSPCRFGLYRSTVGTDTLTNGLFENLEEFMTEESSEEESSEEESSEEESSEEESSSEESLKTESSSDESDGKESAESTESTEETGKNEPTGEEDASKPVHTTNIKSNSIDIFPIILIGCAVLCILIYITTHKANKD